MLKIIYGIWLVVNIGMMFWFSETGDLHLFLQTYHQSVYDYSIEPNGLETASMDAHITGLILLVAHILSLFFLFFAVSLSEHKVRLARLFLFVYCGANLLFFISLPIGSLMMSLNLAHHPSLWIGPLISTLILGIMARLSLDLE